MGPSTPRLLSAIVMATALLACGGKSKSVAAPPAGGAGGNGLAGASNCRSAGDCPKAEPAYGANMAPGGAFVGWVGEPVNWRVFGIDDNTKSADGTGSSRKMVVLLDKVPEGADFTPGKGDKLSSEASIVWTPKKELSGKFSVVIRDYERCKVDGNDNCDSYKPLEKYDKRYDNLKWMIKDRDALAADLEDGRLDESSGLSEDGSVTVSDPNCGGAAAPTTDSQITGKLMQTFIGALANPSGLLQTGVQIFGGLSSGSGTPADPSEC